MLSSVPAVSPILKAPACTPPTVAGPISTFALARANAMSFFASRSGTPSAITAATRTVGCRRASIVESNAERNEA